MDEIDRSFGKRLRKVREGRDLTLEELGDLSGVGFKFCGDVERGRVGISLGRAYRLAHALEVPLDRLVGKPLGGSTSDLIREAGEPRYRAPSTLHRVVASIRRWSEDDLGELEDIAKAMEKRRSPRAKARKRRPT